MGEHLWIRFIKALDNAELDAGRATAEFKRIVERYSEHHRHYHNLMHIKRLLGLCEELQLGDPDLILAVVYHDIIYRPGSSKNEAKSAAIARDSLERLYLDTFRINKVSEMILATANHLDQPDDPLTQVLLDLDMSILGTPREEYQAYANGVRREYFQIPEFVFRKNRRKFLKKILAAEYIFRTDLFREEYESSARVNVEWELEM